MSARRVKLLAILAGAVLGALTLTAWTQPWFGLTLASGQKLSVAGQVAAPALSALGLAALALAAALSIAGRIARYVLGVLQIVIGVLVVGSTVAALSSPVSASAATITAAVGESGAVAVAALVASVSVSGWPYLAVVFGVLSAAVGIVMLVTARRWPVATRRFESSAAGAGAASGAAVSPADSWDALSDGRDPT